MKGGRRLRCASIIYVLGHHGSVTKQALSLDAHWLLVKLLRSKLCLPLVDMEALSAMAGPLWKVVHTKGDFFITVDDNSQFLITDIWTQA